jgi:hypothetical protein
MKKCIFSLILIFTFPVTSFAQSATNAQVLSYMRYLSSKMVHRSLTSAEATRLQSEGRAAIAPIVEQWTREENFSQSVRIYVENLLQVSGTSNGINYSLPGNLGLDIARKDRPYGDLLTASQCVNASGQVIACDTNAPFSAGVLTTRAYMVKYAGAYNISRAGKMTYKFLCMEYPFPQNEEPPLTQQDLIPQFATTAGAITFGNGNNCFSCHSQFGHHAQFMVKFDANGFYQANASGLQNPSAGDGASFNGLMTSHMVNSTRAANERSQMLGRPAANLAEAARAIVDSRRFLPCATKNLMKHYLKLKDQDVATIRPELLDEITKIAKTRDPQPSFADLMITIISHPKVLESFTKTGVQP